MGMLINETDEEIKTAAGKIAEYWRQDRLEEIAKEARIAKRKHR
jgi:hypothetical protein